MGRTERSGTGHSGWPVHLIFRDPLGGPPLNHLGAPMTLSADNNERDKAWVNLCQQSGWVCKICGAVPNVGQRFEDDLCDDCKLRVKNE